MNNVTKSGERISEEQRSLVSKRYHRITRAVNIEFWQCDSETSHSLYVGSYGRGTAIDTSDIDMLVELPRTDYERFDDVKGNGQSRLLQAVRKAILATYPQSDVHADGQVVVIDFTDGIKFEVLPAFRQVNRWGEWAGKYDYPDTHMGGKWMTTDPKAEQQAMKIKNSASNGLLFDTCKHIRYIRDTYFKSYHLPGIVIDSFVYRNMASWRWSQPYDVVAPVGAYENTLAQACSPNLYRLYAPGSNQEVDLEGCSDVLMKILNFMAK